jgi:hypothetical protein
MAKCVPDLMECKQQEQSPEALTPKQEHLCPTRFALKIHLPMICVLRIRHKVAHRARPYANALAGSASTSRNYLHAQIRQIDNSLGFNSRNQRAAIASLAAAAGGNATAITAEVHGKRGDGSRMGKPNPIAGNGITGGAGRP